MEALNLPFSQVPCAGGRKRWEEQLPISSLARKPSGGLGGTEASPGEQSKGSNTRANLGK